MNPEIALVVVVALLWGPTALWLIIRFVRGPRESTRNAAMGDTTLDAAGPLAWPKPGVKELAALVEEDEYWVCDACRSINRPGSRRCYACRLDRGGVQAPDDRREEAPVQLPRDVPAPAAVPGMVPVMADDVRARPGTPAPETAAVAAGVVAAQEAPAGPTPPPEPSPAPRRGPAIVVAAAPRAARPATANGGRPPGALPAAAIVTSGAPKGAAVVPVVVQGMGPQAAGAGPAPAPLPAGEAPAPTTAGVPAVCPFVHLDGDPTTWFDFPHPGNLCHALVPPPGAPRGTLERWFGDRFAVRPAVTSPEVQGTLCLTEAHVRCVRYKEGLASGASPSVPRPAGSPSAGPGSPGVPAARNGARPEPARGVADDRAPTGEPASAGGPAPADEASARPARSRRPRPDEGTSGRADTAGASASPAVSPSPEVSPSAGVNAGPEPVSGTGPEPVSGTGPEPVSSAAPGSSPDPGPAGGANGRSKSASRRRSRSAPAPDPAPDETAGSPSADSPG